MQSSGGIDDEDIRFPLIGHSNRVKDHGCRIRPLILPDQLNARTVTPHGKLFDRRRTEGIRRCHDHLFAIVFQKMRDFADGGRFAHTIYADHEDHGRLGIQMERFSLADHPA